MRYIGSILAAILLLGGCVRLRRPIILLPPESEFFIHGMSFVNKNGVALNSREAYQSLTNLQKTGIPWVVFIISGFQETIDSLQVLAKPLITPSVKEIAQATARARRLGFRVVYKFHLNNRQDAPGHWRGQIGASWQTDREWTNWFISYQRFIWPYIQIADQLHIPLICIGNELTATEKQEKRWYQLIKEIRQKYSGYLVYGANWDPGPDHVVWWDALDFVGVSAYFPLTKEDAPDRQTLRQAWRDNHQLRQLNKVAAQYRKPAIFTEIGYRNVDGANRAPWDYRFFSSPDLMEQADLYHTAIDYVQSQPWIRGIIWWEWFTTIRAGGPEDVSFTPYNKPAEKLLRILKRPLP